MNFQEAQKTYQQLKGQLTAGQLDQDQFEAAVNQLQVQDQFGSQWRLGVESGSWERLEGDSWIADYPPPEAEVEPSSAAPSPLQGFDPAESSSGSSEPAMGSLPSFSSSPATPPPPAFSSSTPPAPASMPPVGASSPPKKKRSGCLIPILIAVGAVICIGLLAVGAVAFGLINLPNVFDAVTPGGDPSGGGAIFSDTASVDVVNQMSEDICYVLLSPSSSDEWGEDWLGGDETIPPGSSQTFSVDTGEPIDFQALNCDQEVLGEMYEVSVTGQGVTLTVSP
jgi:hypothetical protein